MGFDEASTFSGDKTGVQRMLNELLPHALIVHCHCHVLQQASMQAVNATPGIKHVYTTVMMLWKFFHYSSKRAELLKEIQKTLDFQSSWLWNRQTYAGLHMSVVSKQSKLVRDQ